jgi:dTMP kinase
MTTEKGLFISFEGGEGCGKSTQIRRLADRLGGAGREVLALREPGGTPIGERIRNLLQHDAEAASMTSEAEILLFAASRAQLVREVIRPALAKGLVVLCDRFLDSTTVYQGVARRLDRGRVAAINDFAVGETLPDLTLLLDLDAEEGCRRASRRNGPSDRMEGEKQEFYEAVRRGYLELAKQEPRRFAVIRADGDEESVGASIESTLRDRCHGLFQN